MDLIDDSSVCVCGGGRGGGEEEKEKKLKKEEKKENNTKNKKKKRRKKEKRKEKKGSRVAFKEDNRLSTNAALASSIHTHTISTGQACCHSSCPGNWGSSCSLQFPAAKGPLEETPNGEALPALSKTMECSKINFTK